MRKVFLAAAIILLGSLPASGVAPEPKPAPLHLGVPTTPLQSGPVPNPLLGPQNEAQFGAPEIPSTPILMAPATIRDPSRYPQSQGILGPASQSNMGLSLGFPISSSQGKRLGDRAGSAASNALAERGNAK